jgi:hypothetical protein
MQRRGTWIGWVMAIGLALAAVLLATSGAAAQDDAFDLDDAPAAKAPSAGSIVGAFFVSRKADPVTNEQSIEWLGSLILWLLLALSMLSIGLIGNMALTNQRKSIVPEGVVDEVSRLVKAGKYREVLDLTKMEQSFFSQVRRRRLPRSSRRVACAASSISTCWVR